MRVGQHSSGLIEGFTSRYGSARRIWFDMRDDPASAIARGKQLETRKRDREPNLFEAVSPA
jgi:putative endonuclease